jgi:hypothetical protein
MLKLYALFKNLYAIIVKINHMLYSVKKYAIKKLLYALKVFTQFEFELSTENDEILNE